MAECLYRNLLAEMARQGMTVRELADRLGVGYGSLYKKLRGTYQLTLSDAKKINAILQEKDDTLTLDILFRDNANASR